MSSPLGTGLPGRRAGDRGALHRLRLINIDESTVLGIVGAGGIGFVLNTAILGLQWSRVGLILLVILGVVVSEAVSAYLRKRVT